MRVAYSTECGEYRGNNEDSILINKNLYVATDVLDSKSCYSKYSQYIVADGVGGEINGAEASRIALEVFQNRKTTSYEELEDKLDFAKTKLDLFSLKNNDATLATTIAGIIIIDKKVILFNMGDTRIYRIRNEKIEQLSKDHTYQAEMMSKFGEQVPVNRNFITSALIGDLGRPMTEIFYKEEILEKDDVYIICSDGIWNEIEEQFMLDLILKKKVKTAVRKIVQTSSETSMDNMSIICIKN